MDNNLYDARLAQKRRHARHLLVLVAITAVILAVTAVPWILHDHWAPFAGTALAFGVLWVAAGIAGLWTYRS